MPAREIQDLWFATLRRPWRNLALVPAHPGGSVLPLARSLAQIGSVHRGGPLRVLSAEGMGLDEIAHLSMQLVDHPGVDDHGYLVALESIVTNPLGTAVALATDAVLLVVEHGKSDLDSARKTIEQIGHERFIGSVIIKGA
ncbi:MAG: hypothetical protein JST92_25885 [Deltaproteobacteria bacterium]|nr:hypothetical protein [Deltaproteobacteria bacterium]